MAIAEALQAPSRSPSLPPGPTDPGWWQTLQVLLRPEPYLTGARDRYGDVFTLRTAGFGTFVVVAEPGAVREVFTGPPELLRAGESNAPLAGLVGERSVLVLDGEEHLRQRRLLLPPFHGERLRSAERRIARATVRELEGWPLRRPFALLPAMQTITLEVIVEVVFGIRQAARMQALCERIRALLEPMGGRARTILNLVLDGGPDEQRFLARKAAVDELLYAEIAARRAVPDLAERDDVLSMLLLAVDEEGRGMTDEEVRDELVTLLLAGHETTATALAWTFERLLRTPEALARAQAEADDPSLGTAWLDACCREALRVRPVLPSVGRVLAGDLEVGGHLLPAGTTVMPSIVLSHRREASFADPLAYRPERFLDGGPSSSAWIPFGGGVRRCLGASFALLEMRTVLATVLRSCRLALPDPEPEAVARRGLTLTPQHGTRVRLVCLR